MVAAAHGNEAGPVTDSRAFCSGSRAADLLCNLAQHAVQLTGDGNGSHRRTKGKSGMFFRKGAI